jgi:hypothetical protein
VVFSRTPTLMDPPLGSLLSTVQLSSIRYVVAETGLV